MYVCLIGGGSISLVWCNGIQGMYADWWGVDLESLV